MTQHILPQHEIEDQRTMRRLAIVISIFVAASVAMAVSIGVIMG